MDTKRRAPESLLPLPDAELEILLALADGEAHDSAVMQAVERRDLGGEQARRRCYRLSDFGSRVLAAELDRLSALVQHGRGRLRLLPLGGRT